MRPIWFDSTSKTVKVIDQRMLPHKLIVADLKTVDDVIEAIQQMFVRGAPLIGATGAFGVYNALLEVKDNLNDSNQRLNISDNYIQYLQKECQRLKDARPTAVNLAWGVDRVFDVVVKYDGLYDKIQAALEEACSIVEEEAENW